jgi:hypothetical protein
MNDPHTERLIQQRLAQAQAAQTMSGEPQPRPPLAGEIWALAGHCPQCGAPIWFCAAAPAQQTPPKSTYSCPCAALVAQEAAEEQRAFLAFRATLPKEDS